MLTSLIKKKLDAIIESTTWSIQLPARLADFFSVRGDSQSTEHEERKHLRIRARAKCIGYFESRLVGLGRDSNGIPIYTADFSRVDVDSSLRSKSFQRKTTIDPPYVLAPG